MVKGPVEEERRKVASPDASDTFLAVRILTWYDIGARAVQFLVPSSSFCRRRRHRLMAYVVAHLADDGDIRIVTSRY